MKNILQNEETTLVVFIYVILFIVAFTCIYFSKKYERVCFPKSQLTEITKELKTNKLIRGTYNDL